MTGLGAALDLNLDAVIYERDDRLGGCLRSDFVNGYTIDRTGHLLHMRNDYVRSLMFDRLAIDWLHFNRVAVVHLLERRIPYPIQYNLHSLPEDVRLACVEDFLATQDGLRSLRVSFEEWSRGSYGDSLHDLFFGPYNRKLWQVDLESINAEWAERFVPMPDHNMIIKGAASGSEAPVGYNATFSYPRTGGSQTIVDALASEITIPIQTGSELISVDPVAKICEFSDGSSVKYRSLVSTLPIPALLRLIHRVDPAIRQLGMRLRHNSVFYFAFGFKVAGKAPVEHWVYVPEERFCMYRVGILSNYSPDIAPDGSVLICAEVAFPADTAGRVDSSTMRNRILADLIELGIVSREWEIELEHSGSIDCAYALYDTARRESIPTILAYLNRLGIRSIGRYGTWGYGSMEDALLEGRDCADSLRADFGR